MLFVDQPGDIVVGDVDHQQQEEQQPGQMDVVFILRVQPFPPEQAQNELDQQEENASAVERRKRQQVVAQDEPFDLYEIDLSDEDAAE